MKLVHNDKSLSLSSNGLSVICSLYEGIMFMGKSNAVQPEIYLHT